MSKYKLDYELDSDKYEAKTTIVEDGVEYHPGYFALKCQKCGKLYPLPKCQKCFHKYPSWVGGLTQSGEASLVCYICDSPFYEWTCSSCGNTNKTNAIVRKKDTDTITGCLTIIAILVVVVVIMTVIVMKMS